MEEETEYLVTWVCTITAPDPVTAARYAREDINRGIDEFYVDDGETTFIVNDDEITGQEPSMMAEE